MRRALAVLLLLFPAPLLASPADDILQLVRIGVPEDAFLRYLADQSPFSVTPSEYDAFVRAGATPGVLAVLRARVVAPPPVEPVAPPASSPLVESAPPPDPGLQAEPAPPLDPGLQVEAPPLPAPRRLPAQSFDPTCTTDATLWMDDRERILRTIAARAKLGGSVVTYTRIDDGAWMKAPGSPPPEAVVEVAEITRYVDGSVALIRTDRSESVEGNRWTQAWWFAGGHGTGAIGTEDSYGESELHTVSISRWFGCGVLPETTRHAAEKTNPDGPFAVSDTVTLDDTPAPTPDGVLAELGLALARPTAKPSGTVVALDHTYELRVDGVDVGPTPIPSLPLAAAAHTLTFMGASQRQITLAAGGTTLVAGRYVPRAPNLQTRGGSTDQGFTPASLTGDQGLRSGERLVGPGYDVRAVDAALGPLFPELRACRPRDEEEVAGYVSHSVVLEFAIDGDGRASGIKLASADLILGAAPIEDAVACLSGRLAGVQFPAPTDGASVQVRYEFKYVP